ncbi:MAG: CcoQ/FixQ family Cbb3-type cytochrome c oxidase assembly chaperone [Flavobacteriales bacterium]|jgi:cytochrome c oxidase cbb3-type subunit IV|nr:CcoQ/FixQ family Cbb3-type cytochrome c oxidase assembly chaperone [Flavobacteriales bacterium]MBT6745312.1 CcoQ/FixQ family Cbb3-type cytochrome c oxidase assembly chaperone [Flavobacteriales bacterium]
MLKFVKHHMETIAGIEIYPIISFIIFGLFFVGMAIWVWKMDKGQISNLENIPLKDGINEK